MQSSEMSEDDGSSKKRKSKKIKKRFGMEYRISKEHWENCYANRNSVLRQLFPGSRQWEKYWRWYETPEQRDQGMEVLSRHIFMNEKTPAFEYRPCERK